MRQNAKKRVASITWSTVAVELLGEQLASSRGSARTSARRRRPKITVALTFAVDPPRGGGQSRVFHLYKQLGKVIDVTLVCLTGPEDAARSKEVAPGVIEIRIPKTAEHQQAEHEASRGVDWAPVTDIVAAREIHRTPSYLEALDKACESADAVITSHPYFASILRDRYPDKRFWLEAHNVELLLKKAILPTNEAADELLQLVRDEEGRAWREADLVFACARRDLDAMRALYGETRARTIEVPNGFADEEIRRVPLKARCVLKQNLGLNEGPLAIFMGSWHGPNLEAVERIIGYAQTFPAVLFAVVGSAGAYFAQRVLPRNMLMLGTVDEAEKEIILGAADIALNPMTSGSGSNLKMLDYFAAGIPVLSTPFGARGIDANPGEHYISAEIEEFENALNRFIATQQDGEAMVDRAERLARSCYSWTIVGEAASKSLLGNLK